MNKEDILARSKRDNVYGDERELQIRTKRDAFSLWGLIILGVIIMIIKLFRMESPADIIALLFCTSGLGFVYEGVRLKHKWSMIVGIVLLLAAVYFFYKFYAGLF